MFKFFQYVLWGVMTETMREKEVTHNQIESMFCDLVNIVEPDHPDFIDPYPITPDDVKYGYKQASSSKYASCGPRSGPSNIASFSADKDYFNWASDSRKLAIYAHEMTHITVGSHSNQEHGGHPPRFWRKFGFNCHLLLDNWDDVLEILPNATKEKFIGEVISSEVNSYNLDRRYASVSERRNQMSRWFTDTLKNDRGT